MTKDTMTGVDPAKSFSGSWCIDDGQVKFREKLTRTRFSKFIADHLLAVVVME